MIIDFLFYLKEKGNKYEHFDESILNHILFDDLIITEENGKEEDNENLELLEENNIKEIKNEIKINPEKKWNNIIIKEENKGKESNKTSDIKTNINIIKNVEDSMVSKNNPDNELNKTEKKAPTIKS